MEKNDGDDDEEKEIEKGTLTVHAATYHDYARLLPRHRRHSTAFCSASRGLGDQLPILDSWRQGFGSSFNDILSILVPCQTRTVSIHSVLKVLMKVSMRGWFPWDICSI